jgi:hypothetical protein
MSVPRSRLYARALEASLKQQERPDVIERLNDVYGRPGARPDRRLLEDNLEMLRRVDWEDPGPDAQGVS